MTMAIEAGWSRDPTDVRDYYADTFGWPVIVDGETDRIVVVAGATLDVLTMPARFGTLVVAALRARARTGPVIAEADGWWAFLTGPATTRRPDLPVELRCWQVARVAVGDRVILPGGAESAGAPRWIERPNRTVELPSWETVVRVALGVAVRGTAA